MARLLVLSNSVKGSKNIKKKRHNKFQTRKLKKKNGKGYTKKNYHQNSKTRTKRYYDVNII